MAHKKKKSKKSSHDHFSHKVLNYFKEHPSSICTPKQLVRKLHIKGRDRMGQTYRAMLALEKEGVLSQISPERFKFKASVATVVKGKFDHVNPRFGFVILDSDDPDVKISRNGMKNAMHGDIVNVGIYPSSEGRKPEGEIVEVVKRTQKELIGNISVSTNYAFVTPDNKRLYEDIYIPFKYVNGAKNKQKVLVKITEFPNEKKSAEGRVLEVLGDPGEHKTEMHAIIAEFGLSESFPSKVDAEANALSTEITKKEIAKRKDYREVTTFTIDPLDAKDFDDALSIKTLENGNYEIGIHIADVAHYVQEGTALDTEAYNRATSVYLVDRVVPMLPEKLSNGLCSLRPHEDKLSFSAIFEINEHGTIKSEWFGRTVIHSDRRFTYEEAQEVIETKEGDFVDEIITLNKLAKKFRDKRFKKGAINFETPEVRIQLDEENKPIGIVPRIRVDAHKLVEEFMLLANRQVATFVYKKEKGGAAAMVYRVHDEPNPEKVTTFGNYAKKFGHDIDYDRLSVSINKLIVDIEGKNEEHILQNLAIRAMSKAIYTTTPIGHYGLAFEHYTHFTSPIRRYPDVMVHRLLEHYLQGGKSVEPKVLEEKCKHSSEREKNAADAERTSIKFKQVEYIQQFVGETFTGVITGIKDWGFYVELQESGCEGLVRVSSLKDDYYEYEEDLLCFVGRRYKKVISFGEKVKVKVTATNLFERTIDLEYIEHE